MLRHPAFAEPLTREQLLEWYRATRARTRELFEIVDRNAYSLRPISLRNPIVFYEGHLPAFSVNTLVKLALGRAGVDAELETLFERGIDPDSESAVANATDLWPDRSVVQQYADAADRLVEDALLNADIDVAKNPMLRNGEAVFTILEHEQMHHETLLYMLHNLPHHLKRPRAQFSTTTGLVPSPDRRTNDFVDVGAGEAVLGAPRGSAFGWDNEFEALLVPVAAFAMQRFDVSNGEFMEFVDSGRYEDESLWSRDGWQWITSANVKHPHFWMQRGGQWYWRGLFAFEPLDPEWPVYVTHAEASAYAKWRGWRLPTEAEFDRAAYGTPSGGDRMHPWGDAPPDASRGHFDFADWEPVRRGSHPAGASAWGIEDLVGNGWEWTSTLFGPLPGFEPMPSYKVYSADFFDGAHYVMKGASQVTATSMIRRTFRNWFRPCYPYMYATFRCVRSQD